MNRDHMMGYAPILDALNPDVAAENLQRIWWGPRTPTRECPQFREEMRKCRADGDKVLTTALQPTPEMLANEAARKTVAEYRQNRKFGHYIADMPVMGTPATTPDEDDKLGSWTELAELFFQFDRSLGSNLRICILRAVGEKLYGPDFKEGDHLVASYRNIRAVREALQARMDCQTKAREKYEDDDQRGRPRKTKSAETQTKICSAPDASESQETEVLRSQCVQRLRKLIEKDSDVGASFRKIFGATKVLAMTKSQLEALSIWMNNVVDEHMSDEDDEEDF